MPAPLFNSKYQKIVSQQYDYINNEDQLFYEAYYALEQAGFPNPIPDFHLYTPDNIDMWYKAGSGEIYLNGNPYSSCEPLLKRRAIIHLDKLVVSCVKNYSIVYNI